MLDESKSSRERGAKGNFPKEKVRLGAGECRLVLRVFGNGEMTARFRV